ncbi:hypothetical protein MED121_06055 [Marinomonas sp. MED121]|uniref:flagellar hook-length control protein FliK n=1 Tax=Marinomonas sp. MED121 TaxID=314277 RepID=UPI000069045D|nr:flagellar hook-length control protein FliK [Marinomonas sp. MED121]EAQ66222.1 hypothetical protein MED121_06055 [Marinomonas sp. MED121]
MLANANLPISTPKTNASMSGSSSGSQIASSSETGDSTSEESSFDAVFQKVNEDLVVESKPSQNEKTSSDVPLNDSSIEDSSIDDKAITAVGEVSSEKANLEANADKASDNSLDLQVIGSIAEGEEVDGAALSVNQMDGIDENAKLASSAMSEGMSNLTQEGGLAEEDTNLDKTVLPASASVVGAGAVVDSKGGTQGQTAALEAAEPGQNLGALSGVSGKVLHEEGAKLASENEGSYLDTSLISGATIASIVASNEASAAEGEVIGQQISQQKLAQLNTEIKTNQSPLNSTSTQNSSVVSSGLSNGSEPLVENLKHAANGELTSPADKTDALAVTAGLAMIGAGTNLQTKSKATTPLVEVQNLNKEVAQAVTPLVESVEESADLDWIMQQMGDTKSINEKSLLADTVKPQLSASQSQPLAGLNVDQTLKQTAPLSLGLGVESGLLASSDEAGKNASLLEVDGNASLNTKPDLEVLRQLDSNTGIRTGLGDTQLTSGQQSVQSVGASDVRLGAAVNTNNNQTNLTMQVPPNHPNWSSEMGDKLIWMNRQGLQQAEIHLDPPELGSLTVKVSLDSDVASVSFVAANTQVKDLLEGQVQRLREMMAQQGVELAEVDVNVSQQGSGSQQFDEGAEGQFAQQDEELEDIAMEPLPKEGRVSQSKVDFYA